MHSHIFYIWQEYVSSHLLRIWLSMSWSLHGCIYSFISKLHLQFWKRATRLKKTTLKPILFHASYFKWNGNRGLFVNILFCKRHHEMPPRGHRFKLISRGAACVRIQLIPSDFIFNPLLTTLSSVFCIYNWDAHTKMLNCRLVHILYLPYK